MANVIRKTQNQETGVYDYLVNVNLEDYNEIDWIHDPDISAIVDAPRSYWKWNVDTNTVVEMIQAERDIVDDWNAGELVDTEYGQVRINIDENLPKSKIEGNKLAVHTTYKPDIEGANTYAIWAGSGDDMDDPINGNGNGPLISLETSPDEATTSIDVEFNPIYGRIWLHEAYLKFTGAGIGDSISSTILSYPVPLQQQAYLNLVVDNDGWIKFSPAGPNTGTHGFADPSKISLIDRSFSKDGDWNYDSVNGLTPVFTGDGNFKMSTNEQTVHRYVNRVPCYGDCATYFSMSSDETTELRKGYFVRITLNNASKTKWHACVLMEIYRQMTYSP